MRVYINSANHRIISEQKAIEMIGSMTEKYLKDSEIFEDWLASFYTASELFYFNGAERDEAMDKYENYCYESSADDFAQEWQETEVEE